MGGKSTYIRQVLMYARSANKLLWVWLGGCGCAAGPGGLFCAVLLSEGECGGSYSGQSWSWRLTSQRSFHLYGRNVGSSCHS